MGFKELVVWQEGKALAVAIYDLTQHFPEIERYGMISQLRRAAISIPNNIAEGYGRQSSDSYAHFLRIAKGSLNEVETLLIIAAELGFMEENKVLLEQIAKLGSRLTNLIRKLKGQNES